MSKPDGGGEHRPDWPPMSWSPIWVATNPEPPSFWLKWAMMAPANEVASILVNAGSAKKVSSAGLVMSTNSTKAAGTAPLWRRTVR